MTDLEFQAWLESETAQRVVLLELSVNSGGVEQVRYVANREFITQASDTPANTLYEPRLAGGATVTENLALYSGSATTSYGEFELINLDGEIDTWLADVWRNRAFSVYFGDASWPRADFRLIYAGTIESIRSVGVDRLVLRLQDKMERLATSVSEAKLGGTTPMADALIPQCFGECHNVTPLLTNPGTLEYAVHNGAIEDIIEVRDEGVPVAFTKNLAAGRFTLAASPVGTITASVQGDKPSAYKNDVASIIERLVTAYGRADMRLSSGEIDAANFAAFKVANPQPVGLFITDPMNVRDACDRLAESVGAKLTVSRTGLLRLIKIELPPPSAVMSVTVDDIETHSLQEIERPPVAAACKLAYCRNWTVQADLKTGLPAQHKELFAQEWLTATATDAPAAALYRLSTDVPEEGTLLLTTAHATSEAQRRLALRSVQRSVLGFTGTHAHMLLELGAGINLFSNRFSLAAGAAVQVVSLQIDLLDGRVSVGVLR